MGRPAKKGRPPRRRTETGWEHVAGWYSTWMGKEGGDHHRKVTIPLVMDLLELKPGERVLDVGAGAGVLAPAVSAAKAEYVGVDASPTLIRHAKKNHAHQGTFVVGDARELHLNPTLRGMKFDAAVFLLSIQDMDPLAAIFGSLAQMLSPKGRVVILMTHPCFRIPRQSGWVWDQERKLKARRIDRYLTPLVAPMVTRGGPTQGVTARFHRPISDYVGGLVEAGLLVDRLVEIPTQKTPLPGEDVEAEDVAAQEFPMFLGLRARRP